MWSQTSLSARKDICFRESSAFCGEDSTRMAYRCPQFPQTTVSMDASWRRASAVPLIRLATLGFTNGVHDADADRDHCRHDHYLARRLRRRIRCAELAALPHSP